MRDGEVNNMKNYKIAVTGIGYVGLSIATLLSQHHHETAVDIIPEKVEMIHNRKSPIQDDYIEKYLEEKNIEKDNINKVERVYNFSTKILTPFALIQMFFFKIVRLIVITVITFLKF